MSPDANGGGRQAGYEPVGAGTAEPGIIEARLRSSTFLSRRFCHVNQHQFEPGFRFIDAKPLKAQKRTFLD